MRKVTLFAAVAMLAFASCNKEENLAKLNFGGESYNQEKEAYLDNHIWFTDGDVIIVNGETETITPRSGGRSATCWVAPAASYSIFYGNVTYNDETGKVHTVFKDQVVGIPETNTLLDANHNPWPMSAYVTDAAEQFTLKHNVAIVAACVKMGTPFFNYMWGVGSSTSETVVGRQAHVWDPATDAMPVVRLKSYVLNCPTKALAGPAHMDINSDLSMMDELPIFKMDNNNAGHTVTVTVPESNQVIALSAANSLGERYTNVVIPEITTPNTVVNITFNFEATVNGQVYNFRYASALTLTGTTRFFRGQRLDLKANLYDQDFEKWNNKVQF